jgi:phosphoribosylanthranilate isomerase
MWIKICGMTSREAVAAALAAGADAIGFVFAESVRRVAPSAARELAQAARGRIACVAVTRHPEPGLIDEIMEVMRPDVWQSDAEDLAAVDPGRLPGVLRLPVLRAGRGPNSPLPQRLLYEGPVSGVGRTADWERAASLARAAEVVLAGGLDATNVAAAIAEVRPFGVDVSSGVEVAPGVKSPAKIMEFVAAARAAAKELER